MKVTFLKDKKIFVPGDHTDTVWYPVREAPFRIYGLYSPLDGTRFRRMPEEVAEATSEGVAHLNYNTAGGRVTFATDSPYIAVFAQMHDMVRMPHMPRTGSSGFDIYICEGDAQRYVSTVVPCNPGNGDNYTYAADSATDIGRVYSFVMNFPLYDSVDELYIGVAPDAVLRGAGKVYSDEPPIVFYGSSITQGGCVSRPGNAYESFISRRLRRDFVNLGFSGSGKAEPPIAEYMAGLEMSAFVSDYDHNAPSPEYLEKTHHYLYDTIRAKNPSIPYVMVSRPDFDTHMDDSIARRSIIKRSFEKALAKGDKNVYYVDGETLFGADLRDSCTVDRTHPNDIGHFRMGRVIGDVLAEALSKGGKA